MLTDVCGLWCVIVRLKQRALVGLEMYYGDNRDDTHLFQLIKAHDVAHHIRRKHVQLSLLSLSLSHWVITLAKR